jgi:hypothetical protein
MRPSIEFVAPRQDCRDSAWRFYGWDANARLRPHSSDPLPSHFLAWLAALVELFTCPTWLHVPLLLAGAILAPGRRTVTAALRILERDRDPDFCTFHRILNRAACRVNKVCATVPGRTPRCSVSLLAIVRQLRPLIKLIGQSTDSVQRRQQGSNRTLASGQRSLFVSVELHELRQDPEDGACLLVRSAISSDCRLRVFYFRTFASVIFLSDIRCTTGTGADSRLIHHVSRAVRTRTSIISASAAIRANSRRAGP